MNPKKKVLKQVKPSEEPARPFARGFGSAEDPKFEKGTFREDKPEINLPKDMINLIDKF